MGLCFCVTYKHVLIHTCHFNLTERVFISGGEKGGATLEENGAELLPYDPVFTPPPHHHFHPEIVTCQPPAFLC